MSFITLSRLPSFSAVRRYPLFAADLPLFPSKLLTHHTIPAPNVRFLGSAPFPLYLSLRPHFVSHATLSAIAQDLLHNAGATAAVLAGAYALVFAFDDLTRRKLFHQDSNSSVARYFAAFVPLVNCLRLLVNGLSLASDEGLIKSVTREGDPQELLRGPLYYVLILMFCALVFWRQSQVGVISLAMMCGGDGVADIIGRRFGSVKIPYNQKKSWAGSISMLVFGFCISIGMLYYYSIMGYMQMDWVSTVQRVALVSLVATMVESLPITKVVDDNISVPVATMAVAFLTFHR